MAAKQALAVAELAGSAHDHNCDLLARLREDDHSRALLESCILDAHLHRMTEPKPLDFVEVGTCNLSPRFGVAQGTQ